MASLLYYPRYQVIYNGAPLAGGKIWTYAAGTTTPKATYTDASAATPNTNPVILDSQGTAAIWLVGAYKIVTQTAAGVTIDTTDNQQDFGSLLSGTAGATLNAPTITNTPNFTGANITWSNATTTHSGNHIYTGNLTVKGNTTIGDAGADTLTVLPIAVTWSPSGTTHANDHTFSGNVTASAAAPSFTFGASFGNASRTGATTLDWYEETASITPVLTFGGGTTGQTGGGSGYATRVGDLVYFELTKFLTNKGSSTGSAVISGLPWARAGVTQVKFNIDYYSMSGLTGVPYGVALAGTSISIYQTAAATPTAVSDTFFTNTTQLYISGTYRV